MNRLLFIVLLLIAMPCYANEIPNDEVLLRDSNRCMSQFAFYEKLHNIPSNLLKAVSVTESGVWHKQLNMALPWPWAANVEGKPYFFKSKAEAVEAIKNFQASGYKSIDVGCMQINLFYHPDAFSSIEQAFEPKHNIAYAANYLKDNYARHTNWHNAVAAYHSENTVFGRPYAKKVMSNWQSLGKNQPQNVTFDRSRYLDSLSNKRHRRISRGKALLAKISNKDRRKTNIMVNVKNVGSYAHNNLPGRVTQQDIVENLTQNMLGPYIDGRSRKMIVD